MLPLGSEAQVLAPREEISFSSTDMGDVSWKVPTVQLFVTCLVDTFYPQVGEAIVDIFSRLGVTVEFPRGQTCCGMPLSSCSRA